MRLWLDRLRHVELDGKPSIEGKGELRFGRGVKLCSIPVRSHLVTGPAGRLVIGHHVRIGHGASICAYASVTIGEGTVLGPFVTIVDVDFHEIQNRDSVGEARPITIGRNVTIGAGAVILRGAIIEDDVVVAPNSVVSRRMPKGARVEGVPAHPALTPHRSQVGPRRTTP